MTSGHRYDQVWLGSRYGWVCFDATPTLPDDLDFDPAPPLQSQWRIMNRAGAGHLKDQRIVFNVGSTLIRELYRDFEYDEERLVDNDCGGDQRYNLRGRFDKPELWKESGSRLSVTQSLLDHERGRRRGEADAHRELGSRRRMGQGSAGRSWPSSSSRSIRRGRR